MKDKTKERWMREKCLSTVVIDVEEDIKEIIESQKKRKVKKNSFLIFI